MSAQSQYFNNDVVMNSNLVATANEFVPQYTLPPFTTNLLATATEFTPANFAADPMSAAAYHMTGASAYSSSPINLFAAASTSSIDNVNVLRSANDNNNKALNDGVPAKPDVFDMAKQPAPTDRLMAALSISEAIEKGSTSNDNVQSSVSHSNSQTNGISVNGGAIKKTRNTRESKKYEQGRNGSDYNKERGGGMLTYAVPEGRIFHCIFFICCFVYFVSVCL